MTRPRASWTPAMRDGVSASRVAVRKGPWPHVLAFLQERLPAVKEWPERFQRSEVLDAQGHPVRADAPCVEGAVLWYWRSLPCEPKVPFELEVLFQDDHLIAVDKPHFLPVTPGGRYVQESVLVRLKRLTGLATLVPMHRLDLETAGVLVFIVQPSTRHAYHEVLKHRRAHKVYEAVAPWRDDLTFPLRCQHHLQEREGSGFMQMEVLDGPPNADTTVELMAHLGTDEAGLQWAHYRLTPHTGRKHQLRAQMNALGLPLKGDRIYPLLQPPTPRQATPDYSQPLQLLARSIEFVDPISAVQRVFTSRRTLSFSLERPST